MRRFLMWFWGHSYYSTACLHREHVRCPGICTFCDRPCVCKCHEEK